MSKVDGRTLIALLSDKPVAYHPDIARIVGSVKAAIFLSQLLYWTGKEKRSDGFIWKTRAEMEEETALSRGEQEGARKKLKALGVLEEKRAGIPAKLHYRINVARLTQLIDEYYSKQASNVQSSGKQDCAKVANCDAAKAQSITESTTENTHPPSQRAARAKATSGGVPVVSSLSDQPSPFSANDRGEWVFARMGVKGRFGGEELAAWRTAVATLSRPELLAAVEYVQRKGGGAGGVRHCINLLRQKSRDSAAIQAEPRQPKQIYIVPPPPVCGIDSPPVMLA